MPSFEDLVLTWHSSGEAYRCSVILHTCERRSRGCLMFHDDMRCISVQLMLPYSCLSHAFGFRLQAFNKKLRAKPSCLMAVRDSHWLGDSASAQYLKSPTLSANGLAIAPRNCAIITGHKNTQRCYETCFASKLCSVVLHHRRMCCESCLKFLYHV